MNGKLIKRVTAAALALAMVGTALPQGSGFAGLFGGTVITASADSATSGQCGANAEWNFDADTKTLTISGTGDMYNFGYSSSSRPPWVSLQSDIENIVIEDGITSIGDNAFHGNMMDQNSFKHASIGKDVTKIGENAFYHNINLETVNLPDGLVSIGTYAFYTCDNLTSDIIIPDSVTEIKDYAFQCCRKIKSLKIGKGLEILPECVFDCCSSIGRVVVPSNVKTIKYAAFAGCDSLKSVCFEDGGVESVADSAFANCKKVTSVYLGDSLKTIGSSFFTDSDELTALVIPSSVTSLSSWTFSFMKENTTIAFDGTKEQWDAISGSSSVPAKVKVTYTADSGVRLYGHSLSLLDDGNIGVNFYMMLPESIRKSDTAIVRFTIPTSASQSGYIVNDVPADKARRTEVFDDGTRYDIFACNVAAREMTSKITAQVIDEANDIYGPVYTYSVKDYADYIIDHQDDSEVYAKAVDLVKAMLNYGAYSQIYFDKNTSDLANADLTEAEKDVSGVKAEDIDKPFIGDVICIIPYVNTSLDKVTLSLKSKIELVLYFTNPEYDISFVCENGNEVVKQTSGNYQIARITGIAPHKLGDDYNLYMYIGGDKKEEIAYVKYCPLTYCYYVVKENRGSKELQDVCKALFLFYQAADNYDFL